MKKVVVIGANGMAGHMISAYLAQTGRYYVMNLSHGGSLTPDDIQVDVKNFDGLIKAIRQATPEAIVNCAGLLIEASEKNRSLADLLNSHLPRQLEALFAATSTKIIHLSTDCVFSGKKGGYKENDLKDGESVYARTKALGEIVNQKDLTFRTSIIGPELTDKGTGLFHWALTRQGEVKGYTQVFWTGVTTLELAKSVEKSLDRLPYGLYHLVPNSKISKYELLSLIYRIWPRSITLAQDSGYQSDKSMVNTRKDFVFNIPGYREMLVELKTWMDDHAGLYAHYRIPLIQESKPR